MPTAILIKIKRLSKISLQPAPFMEIKRLPETLLQLISSIL
jgi:hypothetical protein